MATTLDKSESEVSKSSTFSYAQAAKGLSGSEKATAPLTKPLSRSQSPANGNSSKSGIIHSSAPDAKSDVRRNSYAEKSMSPVASIESRSRRDHVAEIATNSGQGSRGRPASSSPEYVVSSTSTLVKEDDNLSLPNAGSSESTWENKSQASVQVDKLNENQENEGAKSQEQEQSKAPLSSKLLQEAPVPVVNFWKQRANEAKAKHEVPAIPGKAYAGLKAADVTSQTNGNDSERHTLKNISDSHPNNSTNNQPLSNDIKNRKKSLDTSVVGLDTSIHSQSHNSYHAPDGSSDAHTGLKSSFISVGPTDKFENEDGPISSLVHDHELWPTPENAHDDERKKAQSRGEKGEKEKAGGNNTRPHGKNEWVPVPYTPSVVFNTPLPKINVRRGRGGGRAGREVGLRTGPQNTYQQAKDEGESVQTTEPPSAERPKRGRHDTITTESDKTSPRQRTASIVEDASTGPDIISPAAGGSFKGAIHADRNEHSHRTRSSPQRQQVPSQSLYVRHSYSGRGKGGRRFEGHGNYERRRVSEAGYSRFDNISTYAKPTAEHGMNPDGLRSSKFGLHVDTFPHSRQNNNDRRSDYRSYGTYPSRDRDEIRGRANIRNRNHFQSLSGPNQTSNLPYSASSIGNGSTLAYVPKSPAFQQNHQNNESYGMSNNHVRYRASVPRPSNHLPDGYGRHNSESTAHAFPPYHPAAYQATGYDFSASQPLSAPPYGTYIDPYSLMSMVSMQLEYYFSVDNLCKDMFLRKHMDSQGFVFLSVISDFNRIKQLTTDLEIIRSVCYQSQSIEYKIGADGRDRLRRRDGWETWILPLKDRDRSAQNDGPTELSHPPIPCSQGYDAALPIRQPVSATAMMPCQGPTFSDPSYLPANDTTTPAPDAQVIDHQSQANNLRAADVPLVVSSMISGNSPMRFASVNSQPRAEEDSFPDNQIEDLSVIVRKQERSSQSEPYRQSDPHTFLNGSIDGPRNIHETPRNASVADGLIANGEVTPSLDESISFAQNSNRKNKIFLEKDVAKTPVRLFWVKDREAPVEKLPTDASYEYYTDILFRALSQRENSALGSCPFEVEILYQFWSHFLVRNFNTSMYDEFRRLAFEDVSERMSDVGLQNLIKFYSESLHSQTTIRDRVARHFVDLVNLESSQTDRPAFKKLRSAWRNGALSLRNRKRISIFIDPDLRAALES